MNKEKERKIELESEAVYNYDFYDQFLKEDYDGRRLYLNEEIDELSTHRIIYHILRYNRQDRGKPKNQRDPIVLYINSPGGSVSDGYGLVDAICASETPVYTVNTGMCASMALLIFLAGEKRYTFAHGEFLLHEMTIGDDGHISKIKDRLEFVVDKVSRTIKEYVLLRTNLDEQVYDAKSRVEWWFLPEEAKRIGAADFVVGKDCTMSDIL